MRQLTVIDLMSVHGGRDSMDFPGWMQTVAQTSASILRPELMFGAVALGLIFSPAGWPMTMSGATVGAVIGFAYSQLFS